MPRIKSPLLVAGLLAVLAGCAGGGHPSPGAPVRPPAPAPAPAPTPVPAPEPDDSFTFHAVGPHADPLPHDPVDQAQPHVPGRPKDGAGVFVYAEHDHQVYVLLARRAPWLSHAGTWGVFGGSVETSDVDATGQMSYARAAEHELYEESVTVYHQTDALALRACPAQLNTWRNGSKFRTFFSRQPYHPAEKFNKGYADAERNNRPHRFRENDQYLWVRLQDLKDCAAAHHRTYTFRDPAGHPHPLNLFHGFYYALTSPAYRHQMDALTGS